MCQRRLSIVIHYKLLLLGLRRLLLLLWSRFGRFLYGLHLEAGHLADHRLRIVRELGLRMFDRGAGDGRVLLGLQLLLLECNQLRGFWGCGLLLLLLGLLELLLLLLLL